ncbi:DUF2975 domain-containing protein [Nocardia asteroides]|uniref:DUF2975 domain-containing protein n=1 Tax=Nocardia asteroides TaxID=1824 RepID=UPI001E43A499|nr:DUF2975 domain-containing protein [Nocardia asteroides]UGT57612.1 DUF2975 domain-containing protein [Nocardia asteroides]
MPIPSRRKWTGTDNAVLRAVLLVAIAITGLFAAYQMLWVAGLVPATGTGHPTAIVVDRPSDVAAPRLDVRAMDGVDVTDDGAMVITFHDPDAMERLLLAAPGLLGAAAALVVLVCALRVATTLGREDPFVPANARRIYTIAITFLAATLLVPALAAFTRAELQARALTEHSIVLLRFSIDFASPTGAALLAGVALIALAEVFRRGTTLRDDAAGLV